MQFQVYLQQFQVILSNFNFTHGNFFTATSISQAISPKYGGPVYTPLDKKAILKIINQTVLR